MKQDPRSQTTFVSVEGLRRVDATGNYAVACELLLNAAVVGF